MGGKSDMPPAPDYTPLISQNAEAARESAVIAREQLAWAKQQYASDREVTQQFMDVMLPNMKSESRSAAADRERYRGVFQPIEDRLVRDAAGYDTPQRREAEAGRIQADVSQSFDQQRVAALKNLESFGVDPSMARAGALDKSARVAQAAASAGAANASRLQTEMTGRSLQGEIVNLGRGYQGQIAQAYATSQQAGAGALSANLAQTGSGAGTMGTATQWNAARTGSLANWGANLGGQAGQWNSAAGQNNAAGAQQGAIAGGVIGVAGAVLAPFTYGASVPIAAAAAGAVSSSVSSNRTPMISSGGSYYQG